jgi:hypothetical protein
MHVRGISTVHAPRQKFAEVVTVVVVSACRRVSPGCPGPGLR